MPFSCDFSTIHQSRYTHAKQRSLAERLSGHSVAWLGSSASISWPKNGKNNLETDFVMADAKTTSRAQTISKIIECRCPNYRFEQRDEESHRQEWRLNNLRLIADYLVHL